MRHTRHISNPSTADHMRQEQLQSLLGGAPPWPDGTPRHKPRLTMVEAFELEASQLATVIKSGAGTAAGRRVAILKLRVITDVLNNMADISATELAAAMKHIGDIAGRM